MAGPSNLHRIENTFVGGAPANVANAALILVHGRGATPESMLPLAEAFGRDDIHYVAPRATQNTWYPNSFLAPIDTNEPWLYSSLSLLSALIEKLSAEGFSSDRIGIVGFSQWACLTSEFIARNAQRYGMVGILTGGLIGPPGTPRDYAGAFEGTPVFLGCSDVDAHIPVDRVNETADVFRRMGAAVDERIYAGMGHLVNADEIAAVRKLLG